MVKMPVKEGSGDVQEKERHLEAEVDYRKELQRKRLQEMQGATRSVKDAQRQAMKEASFPEMFFG